MLHDIAAIQRIYGANDSTRDDHTTYGFNSTVERGDYPFNIYDFEENPTPVFTIWDGGGLDTLDFSGFSGRTTIDLREGHFSSTPFQFKNIAIAYGTAAQGAQFNQIDATHWQVVSADGLVQETIAFGNAPLLTSGDFDFL